MEAKLKSHRINMWIAIGIIVACLLINWFFVIYWFIYGSYSVLASLFNLILLIPATKAAIGTIVVAKDIKSNPSVRLMIGYLLVSTIALLVTGVSVSIGLMFAGLGEAMLVLFFVCLIAAFINLIFTLVGISALRRLKKQSKTTFAATIN